VKFAKLASNREIGSKSLAEVNLANASIKSDLNKLITIIESNKKVGT
jgi:hypothetical protein